MLETNSTRNMYKMWLLENNSHFYYIVLKAIQWVQDRKVLGQAFKQKSYFDEALRLSNIGSKATVDLLRQSVNQNQTVDHHSLFMHGFLKIAAGVYPKATKLGKLSPISDHALNLPFEIQLLRIDHEYTVEYGSCYRYGKVNFKSN
jgi:hypothetical protein